MPHMKAIAGHKGLRRLANYLTKGGRALAFDSLNVVEFERRGDGKVRWDQVMDETRRAFGNDWTDGKRVRTYNHYIISLDPRDSEKAPLWSFRMYVEEWAQRWFDDRLGTFQVAIVYHDDNAERARKGERGILHAHVVVNNTDIRTGRRLSPLLTNKVVQEMRVDLERAALALGWHAFSEDMRSMTAEEMEAAGVRLTRSRGESIRRLMELDGVEKAPVEAADIAPDRADPGGEGPAQRTPEDRGALDALLASRRDSARERGRREAGRLGRWVDLGDGRVVILPLNIVEGHQARRETMAERGHRARRGWSWKQDVRDRVDVAVRLAASPEEVARVLEPMGVRMLSTRDGEVKYSDAQGLGKTVRGDTLGAAYTREAILERLAEKSVERRQGRSKPGSGAQLEPWTRRAVARVAAAAEAGSRMGSAELALANDFIEYVEAHGIETYDDFGDGDEAGEMLAYARAIRAFHGNPASLENDLQRFERWAAQRARRGEGGPAEGSGGRGVDRSQGGEGADREGPEIAR